MHSSSPPFLPLCCHLHYRSRLGLDCRQNQRDMTALAAPQDRSSGFYVSLLVPVPLILRRFSSGPTFSTCRVSFTCCTPSSSSYDVVSSFSFSSFTMPFPHSCLFCGWSSRNHSKFSRSSSPRLCSPLWWITGWTTDAAHGAWLLLVNVL